MVTPLDIYDIPSDMRAYLRNYGHHFSRKACQFAISKMKRMNPATGEKGTGGHPVKRGHRGDIQQEWHQAGA